VSFAPHVWGQLKNLTCDDLIGALERAGWKCDTKGGSMRIYMSDDHRRVSIHYHPHKTYGAKMLKGLLNDIGWTDEEMVTYKLIK
jgi:predicted RNA binding protein YcfA (HicA-like mRNA interferase family)